MTTALLLSISLLGLILLLGGSPLNLSELVPQFALACMIGLFSVAYGPQMRDFFRSGSPKPIFMFAGGFMVFAMIGLFLQEEVLGDRFVDVPAARLMGAVLLVGGFVASFLVLRPLRFQPETGLKTDLLGRVRASK